MTALHALVIFLAIVSAMKLGGALHAWMNGYDAGRKTIREEFYGTADDLTRACFHATVCALCIWALLA